MGVHKLNLDGLTIQAKVVDNEELVNDGIEELKLKLRSSRFQIVGFDLKYTIQGPDLDYKQYSKLLLLHVNDFCLLVQLGRMILFPSSLSSFLSDQSICFLGVQLSQKLDILRQPPNAYRFNILTLVDIGTFAARALNNRDLEGCVSLVELASKAACCVQEQESQPQAIQCPDPDWGALCFSQEEVQHAVCGAYMCYTIGTTLMSTLD